MQLLLLTDTPCTDEFVTSADVIGAMLRWNADSTCSSSTEARYTDDHRHDIPCFMISTIAGRSSGISFGLTEEQVSTGRTGTGAEKDESIYMCWKTGKVCQRGCRAIMLEDDSDRSYRARSLHPGMIAVLGVSWKLRDKVCPDCPRTRCRHRRWYI